MDNGASPARPTMPLWMDRRRIEMRIEFDNGPLIVAAPRVLAPDEIADIERYFSLMVQSFRRRAQGIEARRAVDAPEHHRETPNG